MKYIQIDAPRYSYYIDPKWRGTSRTRWASIPTRRSTRRSAPTTPASKASSATGVTLAIHLCRGNNRSQWYAEGGYDPIAEKLFNQLERRSSSCSSTSPSAPARSSRCASCPRNKAVVLGLVSSKLPELESQDQLTRRIEEASRYVPLENLALSPQCGFASAMEGNLLTEDDQWRKLQLVVDTARKVWKDA